MTFVEAIPYLCEGRTLYRENWNETKYIFMIEDIKNKTKKVCVKTQYGQIRRYQPNATDAVLVQD